MSKKSKTPHNFGRSSGVSNSQIIGKVAPKLPSHSEKHKRKPSSFVKVRYTDKHGDVHVHTVRGHRAYMLVQMSSPQYMVQN